jgi:hypothetical protein
MALVVVVVVLVSAGGQVRSRACPRTRTHHCTAQASRRCPMPSSRGGRPARQASWQG